MKIGNYEIDRHKLSYGLKPRFFRYMYLEYYEWELLWWKFAIYKVNQPDEE